MPDTARSTRFARTLAVAAAALLSAVVAIPAVAAPVTFAFAGTVTDDPFGSGLASFAGSFTFDSAAVDAVAAASTGSYTSLGAGFGIAVVFDAGAETASVAGMLNVAVADDFAGPVDQYAVTGLAGSVELALFFEDAGATAFGTDALPLLPPPTAAFAFRQLRWFDTDPDNPREILGSVDSLTCTAGCEVAALPEPAGGALAAVALGALAAATWRRRRR